MNGKPLLTPTHKSQKLRFRLAAQRAAALVAAGLFSFSTAFPAKTALPFSSQNPPTYQATPHHPQPGQENLSPQPATPVNESRDFRPAAPPAETEAESLIAEIEQRIAQQPLYFSLDSKIRFAEILKRCDPQRASELLEEVAAQLIGVTNSTARGMLLLQLIKAYAELDWQRARELLLAFPPQPTESTAFRAQAADLLIERRINQDFSTALDLLKSDLSLGVFRHGTAGAFLQLLAQSDPSAARALAEQLLACYSRRPFLIADTLYLASLAGLFRQFDPSIAEGALKLALARLEHYLANSVLRPLDSNAATPEPNHPSAMVAALQIATAMNQLGQEVLSRYQERLERVKQMASSLQPQASDHTQPHVPLQPILFAQSQLPGWNDYARRALELAIPGDFHQAVSQLEAETDPHVRLLAILQLTRQNQFTGFEIATLLDHSSRWLQTPQLSPAFQLEVTFQLLYRLNLPEDHRADLLQLLARASAAYCSCADGTCQLALGRPACLDLYRKLRERLGASLSQPAIPDPNLQLAALLDALEKKLATHNPCPGASAQHDPGPTTK